MTTKATNRINQIKNQWFNENGPCKYCESWERLEVDHIDPATKDPRLKKRGEWIWDWGDIRRIPELLKCQLLCHTCHKEKSRLENLKELAHGTLAGYIRGCRENCCRSAKREYDIQYKANLVLNNFSNLTHGTYSTYSIGCRCVACMEAIILYRLAKLENPTDKKRIRINRLDWQSIYRDRKEHFFKENGPCKSCGSTERLELDHIDPSTKDPKLKKNSYLIWCWKEISRDRELAKCQILCYICHKIKTTNENIKAIVHGTTSGYYKELANSQIVCSLCREAIRFYNRLHKNNRKMIL